MSDHSIFGGRAPVPPRPISIADTATQRSAMAHVGWGARTRRVGHGLNAIGVSSGQLGTCIGTSCASLPVGFVGPLLWGVAVSSGAVALVAGRAERKRS